MCARVRCVSQQVQVEDPHSSAGIAMAAAMHLTRMDRNVKMRGRPLAVQEQEWWTGPEWTGLASSGLSCSAVVKLSWAPRACRVSERSGW